MRVVEHVGLALGCLADVEITEGLKMASEHGYSAVEIFGDESFADLGLRGVWPWEEEIWDQIQPLLKPFRFKSYHAPYANLNFLTLNPVIRVAVFEQIRASIDIAHEMGLSPVIIHPGKPRKDLNERVTDLLMTTFLKKVAEYAEKKDVKVAVESSEYFENLEILQNYIKKIDSPYLGVCLDLDEKLVEKNALNNNLVDKFIREESAKLFHVRLHGMGSTSGRINYENICKTLAEENYQGAVVFEIVTDKIDNINKTCNVIYKVG